MDEKPTNTTIYWRDVKIGTKITEGKTVFVAEGKVIYWHGSEAAEAQRYLKTISKFWAEEIVSKPAKD